MSRNNQKLKNPSSVLSVEERRSIWEDQGRMCHYCDKTLHPPGTKAGRGTHFDHKVAKSKTNDHSKENLILCCRQCNFKKGKKGYIEFIEHEFEKTRKALIRLSKLKAKYRSSNG